MKLVVITFLKCMYVVSSKFFTSLVNVWFVSFLLGVTLGILTHSLADLKLSASLSSPVCAKTRVGGDWVAPSQLVWLGHIWWFSFKQQHFLSACSDLRCILFFLILFVSIQIPLLCFQVLLLELFTVVHCRVAAGSGAQSTVRLPCCPPVTPLLVFLFLEFCCKPLKAFKCSFCPDWGPIAIYRTI